MSDVVYVNVLEMKGIENLPLYTEDEAGKKQIDLNKLWPVPEDVQSAPRCDQEDRAIIWYLTNHGALDLTEDLCMEASAVADESLDCEWDMILQSAFEMISGDIDLDEKLYDEGHKYVSNDRYNEGADEVIWKMSHWGTLDPAFHTEIRKGYVTFRTYDNAVYPKKLSMEYPDARIDHIWYRDDPYEKSVSVHRDVWEDGFNVIMDTDCVKACDLKEYLTV